MRKSYRRKFERVLSLLTLLLIIQPSNALGQGTAFSYQGRLTNAGNPADGLFDMQFRLFDSAGAGTGSQQGSTVEISSVQVTAGIFTVQLNFGAAAFPGADRYLEISVRPAGGGAFTVLTPRQAVTSTPYAVRSATAGTADTATNATQLGGQPATGFIQNSTTQQAGTDFNISGNGTAGGTLSGNVVNAATHYNIDGLRVLSVTGLFNDGSLMLSASNTFAGESAGMNTTPSPTPASVPGKFNSFFGANAGKANTTGSSNSFFGMQAGVSNTTGIANSFFGREAGFSNTGGSNNAFFGRDAGSSNTTGSSNSFFGTFAGLSNTTGTNNAFFGNQAGSSNVAGFSNAFFGSNAGGSTTTGDGNSFFGQSAGVFNTTGHANAFFGALAGNANTIGTRNTIIGSEADVGADNLQNATAIGARALVSQSNSLVLGSVSGINDATATVNVGIGTTAPTERLHVAGNGLFTGNLMVDGTLNAVQNATQIRFGNTATDNGGYLVSTSPDQAVLSGGARWDGSNWIAKSADSSQMEMRIGQVVFFADGGLSAGSAFAPTERMRINSSGNVGIGGDPRHRLTVGQSEPPFLSNALVGVYGAGAAYSIVRDTTNNVEALYGADFSTVDGVVGAALYGSLSNNGVQFRANNITRMVIAPAGNVGIGTLAPADRLHVNGIVRIDALGAAGATQLCRNASNQISDCSSSLRYKDQIAPFTAGLDLIEKLRPISYAWKAGGDRDLGFGAEEVAQIDPLLVTRNAKGDIEGVKYDRIAVVLVNAVKEQQQVIKAQQNLLESQQRQIESLKEIICVDRPDAQLCK